MNRKHLTLEATALIGLPCSCPARHTLTSRMDDMATVITEFFQAMQDGRIDDVMRIDYVPSIQLNAGQQMPDMDTLASTEVNSGRGHAPAKFNNFPEQRDKVREVKYKLTLDDGSTRESRINLIQQNSQWLVIAP